MRKFFFSKTASGPTVSMRGKLSLNDMGAGVSKAAIPGFSGQAPKVHPAVLRRKEQLPMASLPGNYPWFYNKKGLFPSRKQPF